MSTVTYYGNIVAPSLTLTSPLTIANGGNGTTTPGITAGANITVTGSWPNYTIAATGSLGVNSVTGGTNINITGTSAAPVVNLNSSISLSSISLSSTLSSSTLSLSSTLTFNATGSGTDFIHWTATNSTAATFSINNSSNVNGVNASLWGNYCGSWLTSVDTSGNVGFAGNVVASNNKSTSTGTSAFAPVVLNSSGGEWSGGTGKLKIVMGSGSAGSSGTTITLTGNSVFTSSSSYVVHCIVNAASGSTAFTVAVNQNSGSQFTVYTASGTEAFSYMAIGY